MSDVISNGDHAIKAQDNSALALIGPESLQELRHYSRLVPKRDGSVPVLAGLASDDDLLAQLTGSTADQHIGAGPVNRHDDSDANPMTEGEARQKVKEADAEIIWAREEAHRIVNGGKPTNPFVDLAVILAGANTYGARVDLGDAAVRCGDKKGAVDAYEDALSNFYDNPINVITGGSGRLEAPADLIEKLGSLGVSLEQALADIADKKQAEEQRR